MDSNRSGHTTSAGGIIVSPKGTIAVVNQHGRSWSLPKGHIDPGESELEAARREIYEETGLKDLTLIKRLGDYTRYRIAKHGGNDRRELKTIVLFLFVSEEVPLHPIDPHNPEAMWVPLSEVSSHLSHPKDAAFFETFIPEVTRAIPE